MLRRFTSTSTSSFSVASTTTSSSVSSSSSSLLFSLLRFKCTEDPEKATAASVLGPATYKVKRGKKYFWCSCGESKNQPFCDGSHNKFNKLKETNFKPVPFQLDGTEDEKFVAFCTCKRTKDQPFCDGSHNDLDT